MGYLRLPAILLPLLLIHSECFPLGVQTVCQTCGPFDLVAQPYIWVPVYPLHAVLPMIDTGPPESKRWKCPCSTSCVCQTPIWGAQPYAAVDQESGSQDKMSLSLNAPSLSKAATCPCSMPFVSSIFPEERIDVPEPDPEPNTIEEMAQSSGPVGVVPLPASDDLPRVCTCPKNPCLSNGQWAQANAGFGMVLVPALIPLTFMTQPADQAGHALATDAGENHSDIEQHLGDSEEANIIDEDDDIIDRPLATGEKRLDQEPDLTGEWEARLPDGREWLGNADADEAGDPRIADNRFQNPVEYPERRESPTELGGGPDDSIRSSEISDESVDRPEEVVQSEKWFDGLPDAIHGPDELEDPSEADSYVWPDAFTDTVEVPEGPAEWSQAHLDEADPLETITGESPRADTPRSFETLRESEPDCGEEIWFDDSAQPKREPTNAGHGPYPADSSWLDDPSGEDRGDESLGWLSYPLDGIGQPDGATDQPEGIKQTPGIPLGPESSGESSEDQSPAVDLFGDLPWAQHGPDSTQWPESNKQGQSWLDDPSGIVGETEVRSDWPVGELVNGEQPRNLPEVTGGSNLLAGSIDGADEPTYSTEQTAETLDWYDDPLSAFEGPEGSVNWPKVPSQEDGRPSDLPGFAGQTGAPEWLEDLPEEGERYWSPMGVTDISEKGEEQADRDYPTADEAGKHAWYGNPLRALEGPEDTDELPRASPGRDDGLGDLGGAGSGATDWPVEIPEAEDSDKDLGICEEDWLEYPTGAIDENGSLLDLPEYLREEGERPAEPSEEIDEGWETTGSLEGPGGSTYPAPSGDGASEYTWFEDPMEPRGGPGIQAEGSYSTARQGGLIEDLPSVTGETGELSYWPEVIPGEGGCTDNHSDLVPDDPEGPETALIELKKSMVSDDDASSLNDRSEDAPQAVEVPGDSDGQSRSIEDSWPEDSIEVVGESGGACDYPSDIFGEGEGPGETSDESGESVELPVSLEGLRSSVEVFEDDTAANDGDNDRPRAHGTAEGSFEWTQDTTEGAADPEIDECGDVPEFLEDPVASIRPDGDLPRDGDGQMLEDCSGDVEPTEESSSADQEPEESEDSPEDSRHGNRLEDPPRDIEGPGAPNDCGQQVTGDGEWLEDPSELNDESQESPRADDGFGESAEWPQDSLTDERSSEEILADHSPERCWEEGNCPQGDPMGFEKDGDASLERCDSPPDEDCSGYPEKEEEGDFNNLVEMGALQDVPNGNDSLLIAALQQFGPWFDYTEANESDEANDMFV